MPIFIFSCENGHSIEKFKATPYKNVVRYRCKECGLWLRRDYVKEHSTSSKAVHLDYNTEPISHLSRKRSFKGAWVENLTPSPVFVKDSTQYQKLLRDTNSREKGA